LFGGVSGFTLAQGQSITSDLTTHSGSFSLASGDTVIVDFDGGSLGGQLYSSGNSNTSSYYVGGAPTEWNVQSPTGMSLDAGYDFSIAKIETG
jgi:hypothetical protein